MKIIFKGLGLSALILFFISGITLAGGGVKVNVDPNPYKIIMKKAELHNSGTGEWVTAGEGDLTVDIASAEAGGLAAGYVSGTAIPEGTYDQIRVTISRDITVKASYTDAAGAFGGGAGAAYYTIDETGIGGSIQTSNDSGVWAEGTCQIPASVSGVDTELGTYTDTYTFSSPITVAKGSTQKVRVKFGVTNATTFEQTGLGTAVAYPSTPDVEVTIVD